MHATGLPPRPPKSGLQKGLPARGAGAGVERRLQIADSADPRVRRARATGKGEVPMAGRMNPIRLQKHLKGIAYPAQKEELVRRAIEQGADEELLSTLRRLPEREYATPAQVSAAVSHLA